MSNTNRVRHTDGKLWYTCEVLLEPTTIETEWGPATAETGSYLMTSEVDGSQVIVLRRDFPLAWTTEPVPEPELVPSVVAGQ